MVHAQGRADRPARVAGRRLDPEAADVSVPQDLAVRHAVEGHPAGQAEILGPRLSREGPREPQDNLVRHGLDGSGKIHVPLGQQLIRASRWTAEEIVERLVRHPEASAVVEVREIEPEGAVRLQVHQPIQDRVGILRLAVRGQAHHLVLAGIDLEAGVIREGGVEETQRVREVDLLAHLEVVPRAETYGGGRPLADAVHGQDDGLLERGREEGARRMALVMLGKEQRSLPVVFGGKVFQLTPEQRLLEELLSQPDGHGHGERAEASRGEGEVGLEEALELQERLVVEGDVVDLIEPHTRLGQAVRDGVPGKAGVVLLATEPLLLRRRDDPPVLDQRGRAIVVERRDA